MIVQGSAQDASKRPVVFTLASTAASAGGVVGAGSQPPDRRAGECLDTEVNEEAVEIMTYPRAAALAELAWTPPVQLRWADFQPRLIARVRRYSRRAFATA